MDQSSTDDAFAVLVEQAEAAWIGGADPDPLYRTLFSPIELEKLESMNETERTVAKTAWKDTTVRIAEALFPLADDRRRAGVFRTPAEFEKCLNMVTDIAWKAREHGRGIQQVDRAVRKPRAPYNDLGYLVAALIELQLFLSLIHISEPTRRPG